MAPKGQFEPLSEPESIEALAAAMMIAEAVKAHRERCRAGWRHAAGRRPNLEGFLSEGTASAHQIFSVVYSGLKIEAVKRGYHLDGPTGLQ